MTSTSSLAFAAETAACNFVSPEIRPARRRRRYASRAANAFPTPVRSCVQDAEGVPRRLSGIAALGAQQNCGPFVTLGVRGSDQRRCLPLHPPRRPLLDDRRGDRPSDDVPRRGQRRAGCPRADRYRCRRQHSLLRLRAHPVARAGTPGAGDVQLGAAVRHRGFRLRQPHRAVSRLYFHYAPELVDYLRSVPPAERLRLQGIGRSRWQKFFTAAAMVGLVTAVLAGSTVGLVTAVLTGSTVGLLSAIVSDHVLVAAITAGVLVATAVFAGTDPLPTLELAAGGRARAHRRVSRDE
jgi:hypothetical protein